MTRSGNRLLMAFYGDDFTGSTDALEFLTLAGIRTVLFIDVPDQHALARYPGIRAIGVAGMTRSMGPEAMSAVLEPAFNALRELNPAHVHYKVCSTFDSSPITGSIGRAIDIGAEVFKPDFVPLLVAAPVLGRYCVFGNLFARMGIGSQGKIYRLDRHPSMQKHPVTPADESDLRLHLGKQTRKITGLFDINQLQQDPPEQKGAISKLVNNGSEIILFDAIYQEQLAAIGGLIDSYRSNEHIVFSAGSSGIEMALGAHWQTDGTADEVPDFEALEPAPVTLILSGSCSPVTASQIAYALKNGFGEVSVDTVGLAQEGSSSAMLNSYIAEAGKLIAQRKNVLIHTSKEVDDSRVVQSASLLKVAGKSSADVFGTALGQIARAVAERTPLRRIIVAGGDTSSYAARAMGIEAVEMIGKVSPGAPLCRAHAPDSPIDGLQVNFKGGQVGREEYFVEAAGKL